MRTDFILDFETIGQCARVAPAIDCSYITFTWDRFLEEPYSFFELTRNAQRAKLSVQDQIQNYDFKYKESDLDWWKQQPKHVRQNIIPKIDDLQVKQFIEDLIGYLRKEGPISYWWSRSNTFDPVILEHLSMSVGKDSILNQLIHWSKVRDTRTYIDAKFNFTVENGFMPVANDEQWALNFNAHDSTHDIAADILRLQAIYRAEHDMEQVEI